MTLKTVTRAALAAALLSSALALPAAAALKPGDKAPAFSAQAAVGGNEFAFNLAEALKKGPVVLYFYPKAFTQGCTVEAHQFAEAADSFKQMGATLIGMSKDDIGTVKKFSESECRNKFPVAADPDMAVIKAYDVVWNPPQAPTMELSNRTSYVIAPDGKIIYEYTALAPDEHVANTLAAVKKYQDEHHHQH